LYNSETFRKAFIMVLLFFAEYFKMKKHVLLAATKNRQLGYNFYPKHLIVVQLHVSRNSNGPSLDRASFLKKNREKTTIIRKKTNTVELGNNELFGRPKIVP
jgi:hypothetical protein